MNIRTWSALAVVPFLMACSSSSSEGGGGAGDSGVGGSGTGGTGVGGTGVGGGVGGTGVGGGTGDTCSDVCNKIGSANCPDEKPAPECITDCQTTLPNWQAQCASQVSSFASCVMGITVTCNAGGGAVFNGCESQFVAFGSCTACIAESGDDACETCSRSSCCTERKALIDNPDFLGYYKCINACPDASCMGGCIQQYPGLQAAGKAVNDCENTKCSSAGC